MEEKENLREKKRTWKKKEEKERLTEIRLQKIKNRWIGDVRIGIISFFFFLVWKKKNRSHAESPPTNSSNSINIKTYTSVLLFSLVRSSCRIKYRNECDNKKQKVCICGACMWTMMIKSTHFHFVYFTFPWICTLCISRYCKTENH